MAEIRIIKVPNFHKTPNWIQKAWINITLLVDEKHPLSNGDTYAVLLSNAIDSLCTQDTLFQMKYWEEWQKENPNETHLLFCKECVEIL